MWERDSCGENVLKTCRGIDVWKPQFCMMTPTPVDDAAKLLDRLLVCASSNLPRERHGD